MDFREPGLVLQGLWQRKKPGSKNEEISTNKHKEMWARVMRDNGADPAQRRVNSPAGADAPGGSGAFWSLTRNGLAKPAAAAAGVNGPERSGSSLVECDPHEVLALGGSRLTL